MTRIKLCGLSRIRDIEAANALAPDYVGFVFAENSRRYVTPEQAAALKSRLAPGIAAVGVFVDEKPETVARLMNRGVIDMAQLHGSEDGGLCAPAADSDRQAAPPGVPHPFCAGLPSGRRPARPTMCFWIPAQARAGRLTGNSFGRSGGRTSSPAGWTRRTSGARFMRLHPYAVDVSSGIETDGSKDRGKMEEFVRIVREADGRGE